MALGIINFGMPTLIETSTLEECAKLCAELELDFIELNMNLPQYQLDKIDVKFFKSIADKYGIYYTIHLDENLNVCDFNPYVAEAYIKTVADTIKIAKQLDIKVLNMHMAKGVYFTLPDRKVLLLLDYTSSHRVFYVLMQNFSFSKGTNISGVVEFSFSIPELINWLGIKTVFYTDTFSGNLAAAEENLNPIIIHEANPHIEIYFEAKTFEKSLANDDRTSITINQEPRISVKYDKSQGIETVMSDIECLMQFLGLLIGSVSTVDDIRLSIENQEVYSWLYFNKDFSYNTTNKSIIETPRTYLYIVLDKLQYYYSNWRNFFFNDTFALLRRIYFSVNNKSCIFAEEIFVEYMRILDGYHTRISGDEEAKTKLKNAINTVKKEIKNLLFTEEGKLLFEKNIICYTLLKKLRTRLCTEFFHGGA